MTFPTEPTEIILADGLTRHLRYNLAAVREIKSKWGKTPIDILKHDPEELLPDVLMRGIVEREGLTPEVLDDLITGEAGDYLSLCFVQAFFGQRVRKNLESALEHQGEILAALETLNKTIAEKAPTTIQ